MRGLPTVDMSLAWLLTFEKVCQAKDAVIQTLREQTSGGTGGAGKASGGGAGRKEEASGGVTGRKEDEESYDEIDYCTAHLQCHGPQKAHEVSDDEIDPDVDVLPAQAQVLKSFLFYLIFRWMFCRSRHKFPKVSFDTVLGLF